MGKSRNTEVIEMEFYDDMEIVAYRIYDISSKSVLDNRKQQKESVVIRRYLITVAGGDQYLSEYMEQTLVVPGVAMDTNVVFTKFDPLQPVVETPVQQESITPPTQASTEQKTKRVRPSFKGSIAMLTALVLSIVFFAATVTVGVICYHAARISILFVSPLLTDPMLSLLVPTLLGLVLFMVFLSVVAHLYSYLFESNDVETE